MIFVYTIVSSVIVACTTLRSERFLTITNNYSQEVVVSYKPCLPNINYEISPNEHVTLFSHVKIQPKTSVTLETPILTSFINLHIPEYTELTNIPIFNPNKIFFINEKENKEIVLTHDFDLLTLQPWQHKPVSVDVLALILKQIKRTK